MNRLVAACIALLMSVSACHALDVWRNGKSYDVRIALPDGISFSTSGITSEAIFGAVTISFFLIQNDESDCSRLVKDQIEIKVKHGYLRSKISSQGALDCSVLLVDDAAKTMISLFYIYLDSPCACFAGLEFSYPEKARADYLKIAAAIAESVRSNNPRHDGQVTQLAGNPADNGAGKRPASTATTTPASGNAANPAPDAPAAADAAPPPSAATEADDQAAAETEADEAAEAEAEQDRVRQQAEQAEEAQRKEEYRRNHAVIQVTSLDHVAVDLSFYSETRHLAWPGGDQIWLLSDHKAYDFNLNCQPGEKICYGAWRHSDRGRYWGSGYGGQSQCESCCFQCGADNMNFTLDDGGPEQNADSGPAETSDSGEAVGQIIGGIAGALGGVLAGRVASTPRYSPPAVHSTPPSGRATRPSGISGF